MSDELERAKRLLVEAWEYVDYITWQWEGGDGRTLESFPEGAAKKLSTAIVEFVGPGSDLWEETKP